MKKGTNTKRPKLDPNAPPVDRIPLPELKPHEIEQKLKAMKESATCVNLSKDRLPSVCLHTILNETDVTCVEISEDTTLMAVGLANSKIYVWSLTDEKLRTMKESNQLINIDITSKDVYELMMDKNSAEAKKTLIGHTGPVYSCSFSPDKFMLISGSEDKTIRLWSTHMWACLVVYAGHLFPVWKVQFSPHGYYFATGSFDRTARLWATDNPKPVRIFTGHLSDVDCVQFHPNSNYVATGSQDRTVRLFDVLTGKMVRLFTGHKKAIYTLLFSHCGRYLLSGSSDCTVKVWDIANAQLVASLAEHTAAIHSMTFSRECSLLAVGGGDYRLSLWDFSTLIEVYLSRGAEHGSSSMDEIDTDDICLRIFASKKTPFLALQYTRSNILLAVGPFMQ